LEDSDIIFFFFQIAKEGKEIAYDIDDYLFFGFGGVEIRIKQFFILDFRFLFP